MVTTVLPLWEHRQIVSHVLVLEPVKTGNSTNSDLKCVQQMAKNAVFNISFMLFSFSETCAFDALQNRLTCTDCEEGYTGERCENCAPGYEGNPTVPGGKCTKRGIVAECAGINPLLYIIK